MGNAGALAGREGWASLPMGSEAPSHEKSNSLEGASELLFLRRQPALSLSNVSLSAVPDFRFGSDVFDRSAIPVALV